ncbi:heterokaryon incompatibility, partial [Phaeosphaeriaceae sp. PMI808]
YEALSYVWGSECKPNHIIVVEDQKKDRKTDITKNLHEALLCLRDQDIPRVIWVDAVCIDQGNNVEKASQIPLMVEIYARAIRVIVWLG